MFKKAKPDRAPINGDDHLYDEHAMAAIEKDMLKNIHLQINGTGYFFKHQTVIYALAASVLLVCAIGFLFFYSNQSQKLITVTADRGHISIVSLPDGSKVWLNSGSTLAYPAVFGKIRSVELVNGEAFFDIRHNPKHPFVVHYGDMHAQVLGTSFNIKYYKKLNDVRITVVTGLVEVGNTKQSFGMISPDKEIIYNQKTSFHNARPINSHKVAAWKAREVNLYDVPFEDLVLTIENVYSVKVKYDREKMKDIITTIHFSSSDDIKEALEIIKTIHGLNYTINGKEVELKD
ncbi:MAG: FecR family protein [Mucilaginibacter sp.]|uniref:FecR family protein n=1 Tax=Mucilaginibacter sp. TaxID=1882438 RepID=UPI003265B8A6